MVQSKALISATILGALLCLLGLAVAKQVQLQTSGQTTTKTTTVGPKTSTTTRTTTTTTAAPTTTTTPAPVVDCKVQSSKPASNEAKYSFRKCIVADVGAYVQLGQDKYINLGKGKVVESKSNCEVKEDPKVNPILTIAYECGQLKFEMVKVDGKVSVKPLSGFYNIANVQKDRLPSCCDNMALVNFRNDSGLFVTMGMDQYYKCNKEQVVTFENKNNAASLVFDHLSYEVYRTADNSDFYKSVQDCEPAPSSGRFSFIVYLLAIVAVVLVAYFAVRFLRRDDY